MIFERAALEMPAINGLFGKLLCANKEIRTDQQLFPYFWMLPVSQSKVGIRDSWLTCVGMGTWEIFLKDTNYQKLMQEEINILNNLILIKLYSNIENHGHK